MGKFKDLTRQKFGQWTVIERTEDKVMSSGRHLVQWLCECECGTKKAVIGGNLYRNKSLSCGCYQKECARDVNKQLNNWKIDMNTNTVIGITNNGTEFIIDAEDWAKCKDYCWCIRDDDKYMVNGTVGLLHRFIMNTPNNMFTDHINGNRLDNRKCNLRIVTPHQNGMNHGVQSNNKSGCTGVMWHKGANKWEAGIMFCGNRIYLGLYDTKEDAIKARKEAEQKYFGEFARVGETP